VKKDWHDPSMTVTVKVHYGSGMYGYEEVPAKAVSMNCRGRVNRSKYDWRKDPTYDLKKTLRYHP